MTEALDSLQTLQHYTRMRGKKFHVFFLSTDSNYLQDKISGLNFGGLNVHVPWKCTTTKSTWTVSNYTVGHLCCHFYILILALPVECLLFWLFDSLNWWMVIHYNYSVSHRYFNWSYITLRRCIKANRRTVNRIKSLGHCKSLWCLIQFLVTR